MAARKSQASTRRTPHNAWKALFMGLALLISAGPVQADEAQARLVVERYFEALDAGDLDTIRSLLGERLLARKERLLSNPTYSDYLRNHYQDLSATIVTAGVDSGAVEVNVELRDASQNTVQFLWLKLNRDSDSDEYRIVAEREETSGS